jgi:glycerol kinase
MSERRYILALDQGTTSCRALLFDREGRVVGVAQEEFTQHYPRPGWVEDDAEEIGCVQRRVMEAVAEKAEPNTIAAIGIANQRETTVVWDRRTGYPLHPAIVWQCRRSTPICERLRADGAEPTVRARTGLLLDPYFSATKLTWLFENHPSLREKAAAGEALFGTIDSWLLWNLSPAGTRVHMTDVSNASRTLLYNIHTKDWDDELLALFGVPRAMLPAVVPSSDVYFHTDLLGTEIPVAGAAGDQQAALFGQACFASGMAKNTYGTGCFLLMNTGDRPRMPEHGLLSTVAWEVGGKTAYAVEGSVFVAGAALQWLRDGLGILQSAPESEALARSVADTGGVYFVPAFAGLGTPHWRPEARGMITGLTRGTRREHLVRAALEAIAYQAREVCDAMTSISGVPLKELRVDGGAARNDFLMQFQADMLGIPVARPANSETTALGAAFLAGLAVGFWQGQEEVAALWQADRVFTPGMAEAERDVLWQGWKRAVAYQTGPVATA